MIKLYNSLTKKVNDFEPLEDGKVRIYSCGPTLYDHAHIGNLSSFIYVDTLRRVLEANGYDVHNVMNFTDVDDKTIKASQAEYPDDAPEVALKKLTDGYEEIFKNDIQAVSIDVSKYDFIRATNSIELMQKLILKLYEQKFAYIADDGIYFSIEAYKNAGKKYGQLIEIDSSNTSQARINNDEYDKQSAHDFALWKFMQPDEPTWSFVIGDKDYLGRPGWHIECSAMSTSLLGQPFDIHTGGVDLIFPHHENEIAQSTATESNPIYADVFFHNEHLLVDNKKMSKSLGNYFILDDVLEHHVDPLAFRLLVLQGHYRKQSDFTWDLLDAAQTRLDNLRNISALRYQVVTKPDQANYDFNFAYNEIIDRLNDDLNTPNALSALSESITGLENNLVSESKLNDFKDFFTKIDNLFGLNLSSVEDIDEESKEIVKRREEARSNKDFAYSDELRKELESKKIGVRDTPLGPIWYRA